MNQQGTDNYERTCDAALGWIARLSSDKSSEEDQQSFALWLGQDSSHAHAIDQMLDLWDDLAVVSRLPEKQAAIPQTASNSPRWIAASVGLAACLVLAIFLWPQYNAQPDSTTYRTAMGERSTISLPDKSKVVLNTDSSISVTYTDEQRHIKLTRGEAWFQVAPNKQRPFHVDAGEARITAIGTAFNIHLQGDSTDITVTEGVVRVAELGKTGSRTPSTEIVRMNQRLITGGAWDVANTDETVKHLAWQQGELVAQKMPLPDLIQELERYHPTRILIGHPDLYTLSVSGVFPLDQPETTLKALELSLDLRIKTINDTTIQLLKAGQ